MVSDWKNSIEEKRWEQVGVSLDKEEAIVQKRRNDNTPGKSSVGYNILNAHYLPTHTGN